MKRLLVTIMTTGGTPASEAVLVREDSTTVTSARTHVGARGPQVSAPRGAEGSAAATTASESKPRGCLAPRPSPLRDSRPARCSRANRDATPRGRARPHPTPRKGERAARDIPLALPGAAAVSYHLRTRRGCSKSRDTPGGLRTTREEALYQVGTPPDTTRLECIQPPPRPSCPSTTRILPFY